MNSYFKSNPFCKNYQFHSTFDKEIPLHTSPHYTDKRFEKEQTVFGKEPKDNYGHKGLKYVYSDRLWQWDWDKAASSREKANESKYQPKSCLWYEVFLSAYIDEPVTIEHIVAGVNHSNGYSYYILGYKTHT